MPSSAGQAIEQQVGDGKKRLLTVDPKSISPISLPITVPTPAFPYRVTDARNSSWMTDNGCYVALTAEDESHSLSQFLQVPRRTISEVRLTKSRFERSLNLT